MNKYRTRISTKLIVLSSLLSMFLLLSSACAIPTEDETAMLDELLERLEAVDGEITFATKDGETINVKITKESSQESQDKDNAQDRKEEASTDKDSAGSKDLSGILPSLESKEDVFRVLGVWEDAHALREQGLSWSHTAEELGYHPDKMYAELQEIAERELKDAKAEGLINYEQLKSKFVYFSNTAQKWVEKIFADAVVKNTGYTVMDLADYLPSLDSFEDVFKALGVWEDAHALREEGLTWSHVARELGYNEDTMYAQLQEFIEIKLKEAKAAGLINHEQLEYKFEYFNEIAMQWVEKIFADTAGTSTNDIVDIVTDLVSILPPLNSFEDVFKALGVWEDAHVLREEGLTWFHIAGELDYHADKMYVELQEIADRELRDAKTDGLINHEQFGYMFNDFCEKAMDWVQEIFAANADV